MKKIRTAEEILQDVFNSDKSLPYDREELQMSITLNPQLEYFEEAINKAQQEAIEATLELAAEKAEGVIEEVVDQYTDFPYHRKGTVDKQSILGLKEELLKQIK